MIAETSERPGTTAWAQFWVSFTGAERVVETLLSGAGEAPDERPPCVVSNRPSILERAPSCAGPPPSANRPPPAPRLTWARTAQTQLPPADPAWHRASRRAVTNRKNRAGSGYTLCRCPTSGQESPRRARPNLYLQAKPLAELNVNIDARLPMLDLHLDNKRPVLFEIQCPLG